MDFSTLYKIMQNKKAQEYQTPDTDNFVQSPEYKNQLGFLGKIKQIESSNGEDTDHDLIQKGIHKGYSAIGNYGLMPLTVKDIIKSAKSHNEPMSEDLNNIVTADPHYYKDMMENRPELQDETAGLLAKKLLNRFGDEDTAAYSWNNGSNLMPDDITDKDLNQSEYVKKFRRLKETP